MPTKYPHVVRAEKYALDVIEGRIPACKWVRLACQRHFDDKEKSKGKGYKFKFDRALAERVCVFGEKLPHVKDKWAGKLIILEPWQCFILCMIFGWVDKVTGLRRFRRADIMIPRKNGKSTVAAIVALYMLVADGENGAEVYIGATSEAQAFEVYRPAKWMVEKCPDLQAYFGVMAGSSAISQVTTNSFIKRLIGNPGDGASPSCAIHDEYHEHSSDEQVDTMRTGMVARSQPLQLIITTAGDNISGPCYAEFEDLKKVLQGLIDSEEVFGLIYTIDEDDDWTSELSLRKANPNFGVSVNGDDLLRELKNAIQIPRKQAVFKTKHLNIWVGSLNAFFDLQKWRMCEDKTLKLEDFIGRRCILGLDLSTKIDIAALAIVFPLENEEYAVFGKYYLPEEMVHTAGRDHYRAWAQEGWLTVTDGEVIDFSRIRDDIDELISMFEVSEIAYDPYQATMFAQELQKEGAPVVEYRQTVPNMSEPTKQLDALIRSRKIRHCGNPIEAWSLSNVVAKIDAKDNVYPRKARDENKIDPTVAKIMAIGRAITGGPVQASYTATHGVVFV